jgi:hypothetical protein
MTLFENSFVRYGLLGVGALFLAALLYFIYVGVRALFRDARQTAREAGYRDRSATLRAILRMTIWALFFGTFYLLAFFVGKRLGWWALPVAMLALVAMVWGLLLADRLLTVAPDDLRQQAGIGVTVAILLALFAGVIWIAV